MAADPTYQSTPRKKSGAPKGYHRNKDGKLVPNQGGQANRAAEENEVPDPWQGGMGGEGEGGGTPLNEEFADFQEWWKENKPKGFVGLKALGDEPTFKEFQRFQMSSSQKQMLKALWEAGFTQEQMQAALDVIGDYGKPGDNEAEMEFWNAVPGAYQAWLASEGLVNTAGWGGQGDPTGRVFSIEDYEKGRVWFDNAGNPHTGTGMKATTEAQIAHQQKWFDFYSSGGTMQPQPATGTDEPETPTGGGGGGNSFIGGFDVEGAFGPMENQDLYGVGTALFGMLASRAARENAETAYGDTFGSDEIGGEF